ncbi:MAG: acyl-CoA dehydrogenase family protein [Myxococcales bacterium]|nr:acyl-CoA dehydrogenase family protein [Myxococcales bacterium]
MDLSFTPEQEAFRREARAWIQSAMPAHIAAKAKNHAHFEPEEIREWHRVLYDKGWVAPNWPKEHGGAGLDPTQRFILGEELVMAGTPELSPFGLRMVGPLIVQFGTDAQRQRFLPKILSGEEFWCQGYSEPGAGSDLAALQLKAEDDGDGNFILNGQKTWTTYADRADWIFVLARTNSTLPKRQQGISFLLCDMKTPGLRVEPFLTLGGTPAFCDTYFDDVKVPKENLVGPLDGGWSLAKALLGHERVSIGDVGRSTRALHNLKRIAKKTMRDGKPLFEDPGIRARIARLEIRIESLRMVIYKTLAGAELGKAPGPESSILKIRGSELSQEVDELQMELMGLNGLNWFNEGAVPAHEYWVPSNLNYDRATTIYGGSNEIQRNVIAKGILQLPGA